MSDEANLFAQQEANRRRSVWLVIGFFFYFFYGRSHSRIDAPHPTEMPEGIKLDR